MERTDAEPDDVCSVDWRSRDRRRQHRAGIRGAVSNSAAVKSAVESNVTDVQSRRGWSARNKSYFKRDCMGDYDSAGVKC